MPENPEEEAAIQERIDKIGNDFESQNYPKAVEAFTMAISEWTHQGQADAAAELAEKVEVYGDQLPEELVNRFKVKIGEAFLYAGNTGNDYLEQAEKVYQEVADTEVPEIPEDVEKLTEDERRAFSEHFHALDRLADTAYAGGQFEEAKQRYAEANDARGPEDGPFPQPGPRACAMLGEAACAFALGELDTCRTKLDAALEKLEDAEGDETTLKNSINNLELALGAVQEFEEDELGAVRKKIQEELVKNGGASGGIKRSNLLEITELAILDVRENS